MPPHTTKNSLRDHEDSATLTPDPQEPTLSAHIHKVTEEIPDDLTKEQRTPNLAEAILLMTNELHQWETPCQGPPVPSDFKTSRIFYVASS